MFLPIGYISFSPSKVLNNPPGNLPLIYVTISPKTDHVRTNTEITSIAQERSYTQELYCLHCPM